MGSDVVGESFFLVDVRTVGGKRVALLTVSAEDTTGVLKQRLIGEVDLEFRHLRLVCGCAPLLDHQRLGDCPNTNGIGCPLPLTVICTGPSNLALHVDQLDRGNWRCEAVGNFSDIADVVFQAEHAISVRCQPQAANIALAFPWETRAQVVAWLGLACEATRIDDALLHGTVLTLDRYAAACGKRMDEAQLQKYSLAALCTEMKLANEDVFPLDHWQRIILHLSQGRESLHGILGAEATILRRLQFAVGVPTPLTFLAGLSLRHFGTLPRLSVAGGRPGGPTMPGATLRVALARFLAELALYDTELEYRFPPAILAAGTLGAALLTIGPFLVECDETMSEFAACEDLQAEHEVLLDDLSSYCPGVCDLSRSVRDAERGLLEHWMDSSQRIGRMHDCYGHLRQRHARNARVREVDGGGVDFGAAFLNQSPEAGLHSFHLLYSHAI